jgi:hypothetical protein
VLTNDGRSVVVLAADEGVVAGLGLDVAETSLPPPDEHAAAAAAATAPARNVRRPKGWASSDNGVLPFTRSIRVSPARSTAVSSQGSTIETRWSSPTPARVNRG